MLSSMLSDAEELPASDLEGPEPVFPFFTEIFEALFNLDEGSESISA